MFGDLLQPLQLPRNRCPCGVEKLIDSPGWLFQMCNQVSVFGVTVGGQSHQEKKVYRDKRYRIRARHSHSTECCYYPQIEGYNMDTELCDEISRRYALRYLLESGRLQVYD